jgi:asparagine synthase (glutamine-hydrolysing)
MARIAGILAESFAAAAESLEAMLPRLGTTTTESLACGGHAALGAGSDAHARWSPTARRGALCAVFDGAIFNAEELGGRATAPTDLVIDLYERHGFELAMARINGDFAVAVYDATAATLWLGRDRFGVKPLYYVRQPGGLAFASRPRALLALPGVAATPNHEFVARFAGSHYRTFDNAPEQSPYAEIAQLPAAHVLALRAGGDVRTATYWALGEQPELDAPEAALADQYRELLLDAVRRRVQVARAPGFLLSGGMDSSSVLACAVRTSGRKQHAFSSVYADRTYDESAEIRSMLSSAVAEWHPIEIGTPEVFALVERMVRAHDEPVATATWLSHYLVCEAAAAQGFGSLFGGLGGDELNAGEYEYFFYHFADLRAAGDDTRLGTEVDFWAQYHDHPIYRKNRAVVDEALTRIVDLGSPGRCRPDRARLNRYAATVAPDYFDVSAFTPRMEHPFRSYLKNRTFQDLFYETAPCCLRAEDRQSAAFGLEHFDPFFDHRLSELMFRVPGALKIRDGVTKVLLRGATRGLLPDETRERIKKTGWNAPAHVWFSGRNLSQLRDLIASREFRERGIYDVPAVLRIVEEHVELVTSAVPKENHMMFLWQLVNLELWLRSIEAP